MPLCNQHFFGVSAGAEDNRTPHTAASASDRVDGVRVGSVSGVRVHVMMVFRREYLGDCFGERVIMKLTHTLIHK